MTGWNFGLKEQGKLAYNKVSGIQYSIGQISNDVTKAQLITSCDDEMRAKLIKAFGFESEVQYCNPYVGLQMDNNHVISISYEIEKALYDSFVHSARTKEDWVKFLSDYCKVGRMRQELTIDYAKKLTDLSGIESLMTKDVICLGMKPFKISFDKKNGVSYTIPSVKELVDKSNNKIIVSDPLWETKCKCIGFTQRTVDNQILSYIQEQEPVYEIERELRRLDEEKEHSIFLEIKNMFKDLVGCIREEDNVYDDFGETYEDISSPADNAFSDGISRLENMLRAATQDMEPTERAANIKACARRGSDESENTFYLHLCKQEYILWLDSLGLASVDFIGETLFDEAKDNEHKAKVGELLNFVDGECCDDIHSCFIAKPYTGTLRIFEKDKKLYAGKWLKDAIKVPSVNNKATIKVMSSYYTEEDVKAKYDIIVNREKNLTKIIKKNNRYYMVIRSGDDKVQIPVYIHKSLEQFLSGRYAHIVGTRCNLIRGNTKNVYAMYIDIDLREDSMNDYFNEISKSAASDNQVNQDNQDVTVESVTAGDGLI